MPDPRISPSPFFSPAPPYISSLPQTPASGQPLHRRENTNDATPPVAPPESYLGSLPSQGESLSAEARSFFEPRFGHDFSGVKVHHDPAAQQSAREAQAHAYTYGNHIVFAEHQFRPQSVAGKSLLAHELTHVIQQKNRHPGTRIQRNPDDTPLPQTGAGPTFGNTPGDQPVTGFRLRLAHMGGKWYEILPGREKDKRRAAGWYDFVIQDGLIWAEKAKGPYGHTEAARGGRVTYAGQIRFTSHSGQISEWNNGSGHYRPAAYFAQNAGLPPDKFNEHPERSQRVQLPVVQPNDDDWQPRRPPAARSVQGEFTAPENGDVTVTGGAKRAATSASGTIIAPERGDVTPAGGSKRPATTVAGEITDSTVGNGSPSTGSARGRMAVEVGSSLATTIAVPIINAYLQDHFAEYRAEGDRLYRQEAIDKAQPRFAKTIERHRADIEAAQARGEIVGLYVTVELNKTSTADNDPFVGSGLSIGDVTHNAKVVDIQVVYEGQSPKPYDPDTSLAGDIVRGIFGQSLAYSTATYPIQGTDMDVRRKKQGARVVEEALGNPPQAFEALIVHSYHGGLPRPLLQEYIVYKSELAAARGDKAAVAYWQKTDALLNGPLEDVVVQAKIKSIPLDSFRAYLAVADPAADEETRASADWPAVTEEAATPLDEARYGAERTRFLWSQGTPQSDIAQQQAVVDALQKRLAEKQQLLTKLHDRASWTHGEDHEPPHPRYGEIARVQSEIKGVQDDLYVEQRLLTDFKRKPAPQPR